VDESGAGLEWSELRAAKIALPQPFSIPAFCDVLSALRGHPVHTMPTPGLSRTGASGLWIAFSDRDVIAYEANTSELHQRHIVLHEAGHVLWRSEQLTDPVEASPRIDLATRHENGLPSSEPPADAGLGCLADPVEERAVEFFATLVGRRIAEAEEHAKTRESDDALRRIERSLGAHRNG
jgi:hypothetical protein